MSKNFGLEILWKHTEVVEVAVLNSTCDRHKKM